MKWNGNFINIGDRVTYKFEGETYTKIIMTDRDRVIEGANITSVERPVNGYTTVYAEWKDEEVKKPELLTDDEKAYLNKILDLDIFDNVALISVINFEDFSEVSLLDVNGNDILSLTVYDDKFKNLEDHIQYGLCELGL